MDAKLGFPKVDPHGAQIPTRDGVLPIRRKCETLDTLQAGDKGVVAEVSDHDSELLGYFGSIDIFPGSSIEVRSMEPFDGPITISVNGCKRVIGKNIAVHISITDIEKKQAEPKRALGGKR
ncbi:FeoA family protein [Candidatus Mycalebacterium sp.]